MLRNVFGTLTLFALVAVLFEQDVHNLTPLAPSLILETPPMEWVRVPHISPPPRPKNMLAIQSFPREASSVIAQVDMTHTSWGIAENGKKSTAKLASYTYIGDPQSESLRCGGFDFTGIPDSATIIYISVTIRCRQAGDGDVIFQRIQLNAGPGFCPLGENKTDGSSLPVCLLQYITFAGDADYWGVTGLTGADVKSRNFGVLIAVEGFDTNADIDQVTMELGYHTG